MIARALIVAFVAMAGPRLALACGSGLTPGEAREVADAVFIGTVEKLEPAPGDPLPELKVTLRVQRVLKGDLPKSVTVMTSRSRLNCGYPFSAGRQFLVYARRASNLVLRVETRLRTRPIAWASEDLRALGLELITRQ